MVAFNFVFHLINFSQEVHFKGNHKTAVGRRVLSYCLRPSASALVIIKHLICLGFNHFFSWKLLILTS